MKRLRLALFLLSVLLVSRCTTVYKGRVVSENTGLALKDITITTQNYDCAPAIVVSAVTDVNGNFELIIPPVLRKYTKKGALVYFSDTNM